jgi:fluoride exporter
MKTLIWVFIGGGGGSISRYLISKALNNSHLPYGTILANVLASLLLGYITGKTLEANHPLTALIAVGFCGGFSTFSTFSNESFHFIQNGNYMQALLHMALNLGICFFAIGLGTYLAK